MWKQLLCPPDLGHHVLNAASAPPMAAHGLRPQAKGAMRRAPSGGVEGDVGIEYERDGILCKIEVALDNFHDERQPVEIIDHGTIRVVKNLTIFSEADAGNVF